jgi:hypothetical protein
VVAAAAGPDLIFDLGDLAQQATRKASELGMRTVHKPTLGVHACPGRKAKAWARLAGPIAVPVLDPRVAHAINTTTLVPRVHLHVLADLNLAQLCSRGIRTITYCFVHLHLRGRGGSYV